MGTDFIHGWIVCFQISSCKWCTAYYKFSEIAFHIDPNILRVIQAVVFVTSMCFLESFILDILSPFIYFISQWLLVNALVHDILDEHVLLLLNLWIIFKLRWRGRGMCYPLIVTDLWRNSPSYVPIQVLLHVYLYEDDSFLSLLVIVVLCL